MPRTKLITKQPVLKTLRIVELRGIKNLSLDFTNNRVTGIFGLNGSGKTTILQTIICLYRAKNEENTKMSRFFKYTSSNNKWLGSEYYATMDYLQLSGKRPISVKDKEIKYTKAPSEWVPRQAKKPDRDVIYLPLSQCIPDIEKVSDRIVTFRPAEGEIIDNQIVSAASEVMGVTYEDLRVNRIDKLDCFTVKRNDVVCHSFNLGAGEQRVFRILQTLYRAPSFSLIVIDELDLTLHTAALKSLIRIMVQEAGKKDRQLQIVFTSHRQELMKNPCFDVKYIINTKSKTFCLDNPTEECYEELTGDSVKYLKIYVEDDLAKAIVQRCLNECGMGSHAIICKFGSITNSIRLALGLACQYDNLDELNDTVFVCDGDVAEYTEEIKVKALINSVLSGCDTYLQDRRDKVLTIMKHFISPIIAGIYLHPEEYIQKAINSLPAETEKYQDLIKHSQGIKGLVNHHDYITILENHGHSIESIVEVFSSTASWNSYVLDIKNWINDRKIAHKTKLEDD